MSIRKVCRKSFRYNAMSHTYSVCFFSHLYLLTETFYFHSVTSSGVVKK